MLFYNISLIKIFQWLLFQLQNKKQTSIMIFKVDSLILVRSAKHPHPSHPSLSSHFPELFPHLPLLFAFNFLSHFSQKKFCSSVKLHFSVNPGKFEKPFPAPIVHATTL